MINLICATWEGWREFYASVPETQRFSCPDQYDPKLTHFGKPLLVKIGRIDAHVYPPQMMEREG